MVVVWREVNEGKRTWSEGQEKISEGDVCVHQFIHSILIALGDKISQQGKFEHSQALRKRIALENVQLLPQLSLGHLSSQAELLTGAGRRTQSFGGYVLLDVFDGGDSRGNGRKWIIGFGP